MKYCLIMIFLLVSAQTFAQVAITEKQLRDHISYLASDKNKGRYPGTAENKRVVKYISRTFLKAGIKPFGDKYLQTFDAKLRVRKGVLDTPIVKTYNVIGFIEGRDPVLKNEFIVLGAHYDHLGMGGPSSKKPDTTAIHHGADDNASGTSGLLEISEKLSANHRLLKRSILIIAFGAEEQGLLGSNFFTEHPLIPLTQIKLMINLDMIGRLNDQKQVYMGGAGTFPGGVELMSSLGKKFGLNPVVHAGDVDGSDHVSFYKKRIAVLGLHTGGHPQYHTPEDVAKLINIPGEKAVCEYVYQAIFELANRKEPIAFIDQN